MKQFSNETIKSLLKQFNSISLEETSSVKLMNRTDTKFVFHTDKLEAVLEKAIEKYKILEINKIKLPLYRTLYFDTDDFLMYNAHHQGKMNRYKVRHREYVDSGISFFEIKFKSNKGKTVKKRIKLNQIEESFSKESRSFIKENTPFIPKSLKSKMYNEFFRITLVNCKNKERITIDTGLKFKNNFNNVAINSLVITEVKREGFSGSSDFADILKSEKIYSGKISKYCTGTILLYNNLKHNRFKPRFLNLNKITNGNNNFEHILR
ncbi:MAG: polyphosphate polymerase domain-containing protein [Bacteroidales bacterium]|nr:polyphosphate polymerase domain-containing protein [Bacteroidales bacterium]